MISINICSKTLNNYKEKRMKDPINCIFNSFRFNRVIFLVVKKTIRKTEITRSFF